MLASSYEVTNGAKYQPHNEPQPIFRGRENFRNRRGSRADRVSQD
jgi:hypothetical protein